MAAHARTVFIDISAPAETSSQLLRSLESASDVSTLVLTESRARIVAPAAEGFAGGRPRAATQEEVELARIAEVVARAKKVEKLELRLTDESALPGLLEGLPDVLAGPSHTLRALECHIPFLTASSAASLSALLADPAASLEEVAIVSHQHIDRTAVVALAEGLRSNVRLLVLKLANVMADDRAVALDIIRECVDASAGRILPLDVDIDGVVVRLDANLPRRDMSAAAGGSPPVQAAPPAQGAQGSAVLGGGAATKRPPPPPPAAGAGAGPGGSRVAGTQ